MIFFTSSLDLRENQKFNKKIPITAYFINTKYRTTFLQVFLSSYPYMYARYQDE